MNLVIVESGAKAKKIAQDLNASTALAHLGKFHVVASFGHIRDLAKKNLGITITQKHPQLGFTFKPVYEIMSEKQKVLRSLKGDCNGATHVWIASDPDVEGEAIAASLFTCLELDETQYSRVTFHEINKSSLTQAFLQPRKIDWNKVDAQLARRMVDRLVGFKLSPILWKQFPYSTYGALSAGRVQSACLQMFIQRESQIKSHNTSQYWTASANLNIDSHLVTASHAKKWNEESDATSWLARFHPTSQWSIDSIQTHVEKEYPQPPFITSTLQQECHTKCKFSSDKTMKLAQSLYEAGYITYMRTDSCHMSDVFASQCKSHVLVQFGEQYVGDKVATRKRAMHAQEAHECIRITDCTIIDLPSGKEWTSEHRIIYKLIYKKTMAAVMSPALFDVTNVVIKVDHTKGDNEDDTFSTSARNCTFDGYKRIYVDDSEASPSPHPSCSLAITTSSVVECKKVVVKGSFTQPPPRYSEATMIREMEKVGIGRPSTYATIMNKLRERNYIAQTSITGQKAQTSQFTWSKDTNRMTRKQLEVVVGGDKHCCTPTEIGQMVNGFLAHSFQMILDTQFTSSLETQLDQIEDGTTTRERMLSAFYADFDKACTEATPMTPQSKPSEDVDETSYHWKVTKNGYMLKRGDSTAYIPLTSDPSSMSSEELDAAFAFPRNLGSFEGHDIVIHKGPYGAYITTGTPKINISLPPSIDALQCTLEQAGQVVVDTLAKRESNTVKEWSTIGIYKGPYGYYIRHKTSTNNTTVGIPKSITEEQLCALTIQQCRTLFAACMEDKLKKSKPNARESKPNARGRKKKYEE